MECRSDLSPCRGKSKRRLRNRRRGAHTTTLRRALLRPLPARARMLNRAAARGSSGIVMSGWRPLIKGYFTALRLRESFERHLAETRNHVRRIERVFEMHG